MKNEERDIYTIPPNFIEGGSLMGGMFKTRNVIEAGILAVLIGVPIISLHFSLTVRIIILCLTALPLTMVALIGINGSSLSSFFLQLISFLRNRRVLSADETAEVSKKRKTILPSWAKSKTSRPENEEETPQPKSRNRFQVDWKGRKVTQVKTFLEEEPVQKPLNPLAEYVPIEKVENGIIYTKDHRYIKVVEVVPVNFMLRSAQEQRGIIYSFISYLKIAPAKVQFKVLTKRADINRHIQMVRKELEQETDPHCRILQEDYLQLIRQLGSREAVTRRFFLIFEHEEMPGTRRGHEEDEAISSLQTAARTAANYLRQCGNTVLVPEDEDEATSEILYSILCRRQSNNQPFPSKIKQVLSEYIAAGRSLDAIPSNEFYAPGRIDFTHSRYLEVDGLYYAYLLVPSAGYRPQVPAGWMSLLVNAGDGIDLDMFLAKQPKDRMVRKLGQQLRINRSRIKEASDTNTDFDDLDGAIRSGYFLKDGLANNEDFYYVWDKAKENRTVEKAIYIDECWQLIGANSNRLAAEYVLEIFKIIRGYGGSAICATQDINDFFALEDGKYGKGIINNAKTKIVLNLEEEEARRVQSLLHLSEAEVMEITHFERGNGLISTNNNNVTVEIKCSQLEKELITTDRRELVALLEKKEHLAQAGQADGESA